MRTPPPVRSKGAGGVRGPRQASPRALAIGGGIVALIVIAIVLGIVFSSGGGSSDPLKGLPAVGSASSPAALPGAPEANALFAGIPQKGLVLGNPSAPVEMEMFIDVQCPFCQRYEVDNLPTIVQKYIRPGKVQLHLEPWAFIGDQSFSGRLGLIAASFQNKGYQYAKVLYDNQATENTGWLDDRMMAQIGASVNGLRMQQWLSAKNGSGAQAIAKKVDQLATKSNAQGTPTVLVGPTNGPLHNITSPTAVPTLAQTEHSLDAALAGH